MRDGVHGVHGVGERSRLPDTIIQSVSSSGSERKRMKAPQCGVVSADKEICGEVGEFHCFLVLFLDFIPFLGFKRKI